MKIGHVLGIVVVGYLAIVGINEFLPTGTIAALDNFPDAGSLLSGSADATGSNMTAGAVDLAAAGAVYFIFLHGKL